MKALPDGSKVLKLNTPEPEKNMGIIVAFSKTDGQEILVADAKDEVTVALDSLGEERTVIQQVVERATGIVQQTEEIPMGDVKITTPPVKPVKDIDKDGA